MGMGVLDVINEADYPPESHACPRCGTVAQQRFYGPCAECVSSLRQRYAAEVRDDLDKVEYVPKMNVTPNAVALKDD